MESQLKKEKRNKMIELKFYDKSYHIFEYFKEMELFEINTTEIWTDFIKKNKEFSQFQFILDYKLFLRESVSEREKRELSQEEAPYSIINIVSRNHYSKKELSDIKAKIVDKGMYMRSIGNA